MRAAEILLRRLWPEARGRPLEVPIPKLNGAASLADAIGTIVNEVAAGRISPEEGTAVAGLLNLQRHAHETAGFDERLAKVERALAERYRSSTPSEEPDDE